MSKELIDRFLGCWTRFAELFPANSCIEQTRILYECLREDVPVDPVETRLVVQCKSLKLAYVGGSTEEERRYAFRNQAADDVINRHVPPISATSWRSSTGHGWSI